MIELRLITIEDGPQILECRNDPAISAYMYTDHRISQDEHEAWLRRLLVSDDRMGWMIQLDGKPVGAAFITGIDKQHRSAVWAFYLAEPAVRGKGVGSVVEGFVLETAFEQLGLHKLSCEVLGFNQGVLAMHRKFGFRDEGLFREEKLKQGDWQDVYRLAFFEEDWLAERDRIRAFASSKLR
jgi:UDP-4-amino-4,6-dideoxy-N-acetyl-beta-L-altrosamine N-acetyltransferase